MIKAAILMVVYGLVMIGIGVLTYMVAPAGSNALTALVIPGVCGLLMVVCAVLSVVGGKVAEDGGPNKLAMIGVHAGLVLPLLFAVAIAGRAAPGTTALLDARAVLADREGAVVDAMQGAADAVVSGEDASEVLESSASDIEAASQTVRKDYQVMSLWGLAGLSLVAFVGLVLQRPKVPADSDSDDE